MLSDHRLTDQTLTLIRYVVLNDRQIFIETSLPEFYLYMQWGRYHGLEDYMSRVVPETAIKGRDVYLHPTDAEGFNYLFLPVIPVSGITLLICAVVWASHTGP